VQINLTGHHVDLTSSLRDYVNNKMERLERHFDNVTDIHVILSVEKLRHKAEATLNVSGGQLYADAIEEGMYAAIDALIDKLDRQVKKYKEKATDHHRNEGSIKNHV
jgi:putative sigma-54 modulation protein